MWPEPQQTPLWKNEYPSSPIENSPFNWPLQPYPDAQSWQYWRRALRLLTLNSSDLHIASPLGSWIAPPHQSFTWFARRNKQSLIQINPITRALTQHIRKPTHHNSKGGIPRFRSAPRPFPIEWTLSEFFLLAYTTQINNTIRLEATCTQFQDLIEPDPLPSPNTVSEVIRQLPTLFHQLFPPLEEFDKTFTLNAKLHAHARTLHAHSQSRCNTKLKTLRLDWSLHRSIEGYHECLAMFNAPFPSHP
jgi:hypothetical protein